ncbi:conserved hypothetical protein [Ricinus communis]|uniref:Uncharacterized protein n=1 Tax=Ricinus communis TaxID=3988 RepID=B9TAE8_RICCO|nr:conserved hypothetical protein [Ricinus communis]
MCYTKRRSWRSDVVWALSTTASPAASSGATGALATCCTACPNVPALCSAWNEVTQRLSFRTCSLLCLA